MKFVAFRFWHIFALASGVIITAVMALASISYNESLGTADLAFSWLSIPNSFVFSSIALAFDLGMIASTFGFWHWYGRNRIAAGFCVVLFVISSAFSVHSVRGYIGQNITKSLAPAKRNQDVYHSLKLELSEAQKHLGKLRRSSLRARGRSRMRLLREIKQQLRLITVSRNALVQAKIVTHVTPLAGLEWFLAFCLWFFNATCWTAWFGTGTKLENADNSTKKVREVSQAASEAQDSVSRWLSSYHQDKGEYCLVLFKHYQKWCDEYNFKALSQYSFYGRLIELGAHKYRDGSSGSTMYRLPERAITSPSCDGVDMKDGDNLIASFPSQTQRLAKPYRMAVPVIYQDERHLIGVEPDYAFSLALNKSKSRALFLVEIDRGTMPVERKNLKQTSIMRKLLAYQTLWQAGQHKEHFGWKNFRVLFVTTSPQRVENMTAVTNSSLLTKGSPLFLFTDKKTLYKQGNILKHNWLGSDGSAQALLPKHD